MCFFFLNYMYLTWHNLHRENHVLLMHTPFLWFFWRHREGWYWRYSTTGRAKAWAHQKRPMLRGPGTSALGSPEHVLTHMDYGNDATRCLGWGGFGIQIFQLNIICPLKMDNLKFKLFFLFQIFLSEGVKEFLLHVSCRCKHIYMNENIFQCIFCLKH